MWEGNFHAFVVVTFDGFLPVEVTAEKIRVPNPGGNVLEDSAFLRLVENVDFVSERKRPFERFVKLAFGDANANVEAGLVVSGENTHVHAVPAGKDVEALTSERFPRVPTCGQEIRDNTSHRCCLHFEVRRKTEEEGSSGVSGSRNQTQINRRASLEK